MNKQMTPAEIELIHQSFARLAFGVEYNEGGPHAHEKARAAYAKRGRNPNNLASSAPGACHVST